MRSVPVAHRGNKPEAHEFRVRFSRRLRGARIVDEDEDTVPAIQTAAPAPQPTAPVVPQSTAAVPPPSPQPTDFWKTDTGRELQADRERIEAVLAKMGETIEGLRTEQADRMGALQQVAIQLSMTIATRLLHQQIEAGEFAIEAKVSDMLAQLGSDEAVTVRLHPADLALLNKRLGGEPLSPDHPDPRFVPDPNLGRGDCQVEGRESMLVSDITRELEELREEILRSLKNARS
jgi:hypothetical protein